MFCTFLPAEAEIESEAVVVDCAYGASVDRHRIAYNRQSEAGAAERARTAFVDTVETLEDVGKVFFRNTGAVVAEGEISVFVSGYADFGSSAVSNRVVEKVSEDGFNQRAVDV